MTNNDIRIFETESEARKHAERVSRREGEPALLVQTVYGTWLALPPAARPDLDAEPELIAPFVRSGRWEV